MLHIGTRPGGPSQDLMSKIMERNKFQGKIECHFDRGHLGWFHWCHLDLTVSGLRP